MFDWEFLTTEESFFEDIDKQSRKMTLQWKSRLDVGIWIQFNYEKPDQNFSISLIIHVVEYVQRWFRFAVNILWQKKPFSFNVAIQKIWGILYITLLPFKKQKAKMMMWSPSWSFTLNIFCRKTSSSSALIRSWTALKICQSQISSPPLASFGIWTFYCRR